MHTGFAQQYKNYSVFAKPIEITLSIFTMCSDLLAKRIKLKSGKKSYFITSG